MIIEVFAHFHGEEHLVGTIDTLPGIGEGFSYAEEWLSAPDAKPISLSLPLHERRYSAREIRPFFEGLLPEGAPRSAVAKQLRISPRSYVKILDALGWECIGAVLLHGADKRPQAAYIRLDEDQLTEIATTLKDTSAWLSEETRMSLAGAQPKTALYRSNEGTWFKPIGGAPSTHILKPTHSRFADTSTNEALCTKMALRCGLDAPEVEVVELEGISLLCSTRFDRFISNGSPRLNGEIVPTRLHQEDFCQALGLAPETKYEEGHAGYASRMADLIRIHATDPIKDIEKLWNALVFNFVIGNCDAHLKNYALIRSEDWSKLSLAPLYDLMSTTSYKGLSRELAVSIGGVRNIDKVNLDAFAEEAKRLMLPRSWALDQVARIASSAEAALDAACEELASAGIGAAEIVRDKMLDDLRARIARIS